MRAIGLALAQRMEPPSSGPFDAALESLMIQLTAIKGDERIVALRFSLDQLERNLLDLVRRAEEFAKTGVNAASDMT
jgi:hypothetical protein